MAEDNFYLLITDYGTLSKQYLQHSVCACVCDRAHVYGRGLMTERDG